MVKNAVLERFGRKKNLQQVIREATDAFLESENLVRCMEKLRDLHYWARFNGEAKLGFLRVSAMNISELAAFDIYQEVADN